MSFVFFFFVVEEMPLPHTNITQSEVMELLLMNQYFDTLKEMTASSHAKTIFVPHDPVAGRAIPWSCVIPLLVRCSLQKCWTGWCMNPHPKTKHLIESMHPFEGPWGLLSLG